LLEIKRRRKIDVTATQAQKGKETAGTPCPGSKKTLDQSQSRGNSRKDKNEGQVLVGKYSREPGDKRPYTEQRPERKGRVMEKKKRQTGNGKSSGGTKRRPYRLEGFSKRIGQQAISRAGFASKKETSEEARKILGAMQAGIRLQGIEESPQFPKRLKRKKALQKEATRW